MKRRILDRLLPWLWAAIWFTLSVSPKANVYSMILFTLTALLPALSSKSMLRRQQLILAGGFLLFFVWTAAGVFYDPEAPLVWKGLEKKSSLLAIPVIIFLADNTVKDLSKWAIRGFLGGLAFSGIFLVVMAFFHMLDGRPMQEYLYHGFTRPVALGATYYSCYLSSAIFFLLIRRSEPFIERFKMPLTFFFMLLLLLAASKLFIILTIPVITWYVLKRSALKQSKFRWLTPLILFLLLLGASVPFLSRISELKNTDLKVVFQQEYRYDTPLNGLTFRMVLWRFAGEILTEEKAWLTGTGIGSRQQVLNERYKASGIYTGNPDLGDTGYLGYNFHNQYLETLVGSGIPGLLLLLSIILFIFFADRNKHFFPLSVYVLLVMFLFTESMLERQAGIVFFSLVWTMGVISGSNHKHNGNLIDHNP